MGISAGRRILKETHQTFRDRSPIRPGGNLTLALVGLNVTRAANGGAEGAEDVGRGICRGL